MKIVFSSGISQLTENNSSFDEGVLRVAYVGKNRNNSFISKETFERCMPSIYNCPIVCRYDREEDVIGAHDIELVTDEDGSMRIVNVTQPGWRRPRKRQILVGRNRGQLWSPRIPVCECADLETARSIQENQRGRHHRRVNGNIGQRGPNG